MGYTGDLREGGIGSGIDGADAKCQARAQAGGLTGTYRAWLSGSTLASSPPQRFTNTANTGPYVLPDAAATVIGANWADLTDGQLLARINVTELGGTLGSNAVRTHTLADGTPGGTANTHCLEWTDGTAPNLGDVGSSGSSDSRWTVFTDFTCSTFGPLYCFEQG